MDEHALEHSTISARIIRITKHDCNLNPRWVGWHLVAQGPLSTPEQLKYTLRL